MPAPAEGTLREAIQLCHAQPARTIALLQPLLPSLQGDLLGRALQVLGDAHYMVSDYRGAFEHFYLALATPVTDPTISAEVHWQLAVLHNELGAFDEALQQLEHALELGNEDQQLRARYKISSACFGLNQPARAIEELQAVWAQREKFEDPCWIGQTLSQLGYGHLQLGMGCSGPEQQAHFEQALGFLQEAEQFATNPPFPGLEGLVQLYRGQVYTQLQDHEKASASFRQALKVANHMQYTWLRLETLLTYAELLQCQERHADAVELLQASLEHAETLGLQDKVARGYELLADSQDSLGWHREAVQSLKKAHSLHKGFASQRARWWTLSIQARLELKNVMLEAEVLRLKSQELEHQNQHLHQLAHLDTLTGVLNRRAFDLELQRQLDSQGPFAVVLLDLDHFKGVNDRFGHSTGDRVLQQLGSLLRQHSRSTDVVARYGGEEFVLILGGALQQEAVAVCERLRLAVESHPWQDLAQGLQVTLSLGVALSGLAQPVEQKLPT